MKQLIIILGLTVFVVSCSQTPEEKQKSKEETYLENAQTYMEASLSESTNPNDLNITSLNAVKIDSIVPFNEKMGLELKQGLLLMKARAEMDKLQPLIEMQELAGDNSGLSPALSQDLNKYKAEIEEIDKKLKTASTKKSGEMAYIKFNVKNKDATSESPTVQFVFNEDYTLNGEMMDVLYGK